MARAKNQPSSSDERTDVTPTSLVAGLRDVELQVLRQVGKHWGRVVGDRSEWLRALPVDPSLHRFPDAVAPEGRARFARIDFVEDGDSTVTATEHADIEPGEVGFVVSRLRRLFLGEPLANSAVTHEKMRKLVALPILSSDALSSVAYGPEAMLAVLALAGSSALHLSLYISAVIVLLMIAVGFSYRQIIRAYPHGGGSYIVAGANLGQACALIAAAGLLIDYILTVSVSIAAGVAAITSMAHGFQSATVVIGLAVIAILLIGNLRGVREAGALFSAPTYLFIVMMFLLIIVGLINAGSHGFAVQHVRGLHPVEGVALLLVLRAFSSGATAMTGIEAISNAVPAFTEPAAENARKALLIMVSLLVTMFVGLVLLIHFDGVVPLGGQTVLSQLGRRAFGSGFLYVLTQIATAAILLLAANTAFNGFPRLLSFMANKGHAPRLFLRLGDRLAFSNGTILLAVAAAAIFAAFNGKTDALIPLYAVGVFVAFTLAQAGMVVHWWRKRESHWRKGLALNALGAVLSALVFVIAAATKFVEGAWVALVLIVLLVLLCWRIHRHYEKVRAAISLHPVKAHSRARALVPHELHATPARSAAVGGSGGDEEQETPDQLQHLAVVPVARMDLSSLRALAYAASLGQPVLAVHLSFGDEEAKRFQKYWKVWGDHLPLETVNSPYRSVVAPMVRYIAALRKQRKGITVTVVLPELIEKHWWHKVLHNGTTKRLRKVLLRQPGVVVTTVPLHLPT